MGCNVVSLAMSFLYYYLVLFDPCFWCACRGFRTVRDLKALYYYICMERRLLQALTQSFAWRGSHGERTSTDFAGLQFRVKSLGASPLKEINERMKLMFPQRTLTGRDARAKLWGSTPPRRREIKEREKKDERKCGAQRIRRYSAGISDVADRCPSTV